MHIFHRSRFVLELKTFFLLACHFIIYNHLHDFSTFLFEQQCVHFELR